MRGMKIDMNNPGSKDDKERDNYQYRGYFYFISLFKRQYTNDSDQRCKDLRMKYVL